MLLKQSDIENYSNAELQPKMLKVTHLNPRVLEPLAPRTLES